MPKQPVAPLPELAIAAEQVCFIVVKAREFDAKDLQTIPDTGSNASDDQMYSVLEDNPDDPVVEELTAFIDALNVDEQIDLVALAWLGRGDGKMSDWDEIRAEAARDHSDNTASYVLGMPLLPDYLEEALSLFDMSCMDFEAGRL
ncbi:DUF3775 domain-containing protein [Hoeflea ulvae]|uniref:DUF3775 domain-containing protein n=1 Tax=Hoeflea ulvae TaxID=2983764 RepID=A0ABT3YHP9_9HYPH|nr:DUF3775 domain-containing protein [Hoeflea ulvae]MCY0095147.1 DUF3775 domain-containing protein [Hoeflea ulvae]